MKFFILIFVIIISGCATLFSNKVDEIKIDTLPTGAQVYLDGELLGTTPVTTTVRHDTFNQKYLTFSKDGFDSKKIMLEKTFNSTALWNLGFLTTTMGATSWGIDALSGALIEYSPKSYMIPLSKSGSSKEEVNLDSYRAAFFAQNFNALKKDISKNSGKNLESLYQLTKLKNKITFIEYQNKISTLRPELCNTQNGLELYKLMDSKNLL